MSDDGFFTGTLIGFVVGVIVGHAIAATIISHNYQRCAIKYKAAQYNQRTGDFEWIEPATKEPKR